MKFKDYFNRESNSNRIYSKREIREMKLKDFFTKENELISQYNAVGFPMLSDLKNSPNVTYVEDPNEVFGGRWESVRPVGVGGNDGVGVNDDNGLLPQAQVDGLAPQSNELGTITNGSTPVLKGGVNMNVKPSPVLSSSQLQKFNEDTQKQVKYGANSSIMNKGPVITSKDLYISSRKPTLKEKYEGLTPTEAIGKALSKLPIPWTASQYYGHSAHLADGEKPSWYMRKNNDFYKYGELEDENLKEILKEQAAKLSGVDINDPDLYEKIKDVDVVIPKPNSPLVKKIKNSEAFVRAVVDNNGEIMNDLEVNDYITYPGKNINLFSILHKSNLNKPKGSNYVSNNDTYNFEHWDMKNSSNSRNVQDVSGAAHDLKEKASNLVYNLYVALNNMAFEQQEKGKIGNYILSPLINLTPEERRKIINKYMKEQLKKL